MAVMQNSILFGEVDSADYGIYISGEGVFDAPKRSIEMVSVPGRNGDIVIDNGYYENIEVTYPSFNYEPDLASFRLALAQFRNALVSQTGYQRLSDTFHPDEYRMAIYSAGLEVDPIKYNTAAKFDIKFDCKPQRYLVSGEESVEVTSGQDLVNPTLYDAEPLLAVEGHGAIHFNGYDIELVNPYRGDTVLVNPKLYTFTNGSPPGDVTVEEVFQPIPKGNENDDVTVQQFTFYWLLTVADLGYGDEYLGTVTVTDSGDLSGTTTIISRYNRTIHLRTVLDAYELPSWASSWTYVTHTVTLNVSYKSNGSQSKTVTYDFGTGYKFSKNAHNINNSLMHVQYTEEIGGVDYEPLRMWVERLSTKGVSVDSTVFILGTPTYIDCELGDAYMISGGEYVSLNEHLDLGSNLPKLAPGENEVTFDNTITSLEVQPRWWQL